MFDRDRKKKFCVSFGERDSRLWLTRFEQVNNWTFIPVGDLVKPTYFSFRVAWLLVKNLRAVGYDAVVCYVPH